MIGFLLWVFSAWGAGSPDFTDMPVRRSPLYSSNFQILDRWPYGPGFSVLVNTDTIFYANGAVLQIGEINVQSEVSWLSEVVFSGLAYTMVRSGDRLYVAVDDQGISIVDISSLDSPKEIYLFQTSGRVFGLTVRGDTLYATMGEEGLRIYDCSDPYCPQLLGSLFGFNLRSLEMDANLVYATDVSIGLMMIDVSDPSSPDSVSSLSLTGQHYGLALDTLRKEAWVCSFDGWLNVVDVSDTSDFELVSTLPVFAAWAVDIEYPYAYAVSWNDSMYVFDVESHDAVSVMSLDTLGITGVWPYSISVEDNLAAVSGYLGGWWVFDCEDPANPEVTDGRLHGGISQEVSVNEDWIVLGLQAGKIELFSKVGHLESEASLNILDWPQDFIIQNDNLFVAESWAGFSCYRLPGQDSDTIELIFRKGFTRIYVNALAIGDSCAYLACRDSGIVVVDMSNPMLPQEVSRLNLDARVISVLLAGNVLYAGLDGGGVWEIDVTNPAEPVTVRLHPSSGTVLDMSLQDDMNQQDGLLFLAQANEGVAIYDITDVNWQFLSAISTENVAFALELQDEVLFLAEGSAGVSAYDVSSPNLPSELGRLNTGGSARDVALIGDTVMVADGYDGLMKLRFGNQGVEEIELPSPSVKALSNPFARELRFNQPIDANLYNACGRIEAHITGEVFDGSHLLSGVYFVKGHRFCLKVVKAGI